MIACRDDSPPLNCGGQRRLYKPLQALLIPTRQSQARDRNCTAKPPGRQDGFPSESRVIDLTPREQPPGRGSIIPLQGTKERELQPQTAALPRWACATYPLNHRFVSTADDAPVQSPELEAAKERERQADRRQGEPIAESEHACRLRRDRARRRDIRIDYPSYALILKYRRQKRAISSIFGIDAFSRNMELPT